MGKIRRRFDVQFKTRICEMVRGELSSIGEICREYQLSRTVVDRWLEAFDNGKLSERSSSRERQLFRENERLKTKVGELTMQIDILKKIDEWMKQERSVATSIVTEKNLAQFQRRAKPQAFPSPPTTTKARGTK